MQEDPIILSSFTEFLRESIKDILFSYVSSIVTICWAGAKACERKRDRSWVQIPLEEMKYLLLSIFFPLVTRQSTALNSATQHVMPAEFIGNWGTECFYTRFPCYMRDTERI